MKTAVNQVATEAEPPFTTSVCNGDRCRARHSWPLHYFRYRGVFCRLCTSCVLLYNVGSFCTTCFEVFSVKTATVQCVRCPSSSHLSCIPDPSLGLNFTCSGCSDPENFSFFPIGLDDDGSYQIPPIGGRGEIDLPSARALLAAAQLAAISMSRSEVVARANADKKVRDSAMARKRALEAIEMVSMAAEEKKDKESIQIEIAKKKIPRVNFSTKKLFTNREIP